MVPNNRKQKAPREKTLDLIREAHKRPLTWEELQDRPRETWTPNRVPGCIPDVERKHGIARARELVENLNRAIYSLENYAQEDNYALTRIDRAWVGWELGKDVARAERGVFFDAFALWAPRVQQGIANADGVSLLLLSIVGVSRAHAHAKGEAHAELMKLTKELLIAWGVRRRKKIGESQWRLASDLAHKIWGVRVSPQTLKVEFSNRRPSG